MKSIIDNRTALSTSNNPNLTSIETRSERILQSAINSSFQMVYKKPEIKTQELKTVDTFAHASTINDERPSQNPVPADAKARPPLDSQELLAIMQEMAREEAERLYSDRM